MGQEVHFGTNGSTTAGYLARPSGRPGPGVLVLQEFWGLVPHIRDVCDRFADTGFVALAPDLYHGRSADSPDEASRLMMALEIGQAEKDLAGAAQYLLDESSASKVGAVGFCMGGQLALFAACRNPRIGACVDFYGVHPAVAPDLASLSCPVLGFFGERDPFVTREKALDLEKRLLAAGKEASFRIYPDAGHAFFNDSRPEGYHPERAREAWDEMVTFFRNRLK